MAHTTKEYIWWIEGDKLGFAEWKNSDVTTDTVGGKVLRIYIKRLPTHLGTTLSDKPEIAPEFHEGLISRVLEKLHARTGNLPSARYYRAEWQNCITMGKQRSNREKDGTGFHFEIEEF
jgi:hypothetical protein|tara:strand:- start:300 stop:656 length:357 start_codon:yes stop_codon:yes gene_type:complete